MQTMYLVDRGYANEVSEQNGLYNQTKCNVLFQPTSNSQNTPSHSSQNPLQPCTVRGSIISPLRTTGECPVPFFECYGFPFGAAEECSTYQIYTIAVAREQDCGMETGDAADFPMSWVRMELQVPR